MSRRGLSVKVAGNAFDPSGSWVEADIKSGSITPSTHVERFFEKDFSDSVFVDSFLSGNGIEVIRFGINTLLARARIEAEVSAATAGGGGAVGSATAAGAGDSTSPAVSPVAPSVSPAVSPAVSLGSGGSRSTKDKLLKASSEVLHTPEEILVIKRALQYFVENPAAKTILVDILERDIDSLELNPSLKTHTVVFYRNPASALGESRITVIDPSNFGFSLHLSNEDVARGIAEFSGVKINTYYHKNKIYKAEDSVGFGVEKFRDCVDVAVKIAIYLNCPELFCMEETEEGGAGAAGAGAGSGVATTGAVAIAGSGGVGVPSDKSYPVLDSMDKIQKLPAILAIQRGGGMGKNWYDETDFPVRVRQSSDPRVSAVFYRTAKLFAENVATVENFSPKFYKKIRLEAVGYLDYAFNSKCLPDLIKLNGLLVKKISDVLTTKHSDVSEFALGILGDVLAESDYGGTE